ncbi:potassium channel family protein [Streptomyces sp. NPDC057939]|uniref:potassium channel family protein n=1 Tax=Streptomyces sp. NPDC057939 TaxID=3346284 RepID=UPI0036EFDF81
MEPEASAPPDEVPTTRQMRRMLLAPLSRSVASAGLLTWLFYVAPLDREAGITTVLLLILGLGLFGALVIWQVFAITHAKHPRLRAVEALATAVPLFLLLFSVTYFVLSLNDPPSFSEPLNRTDALYFTVTVFATVGFGDIVPTSQTGRALTTMQMIADLIVVGLIAKVLFGAVKIGMRRRAAHGPTDPDDGSGGAGRHPGGPSRKRERK